MGRNPTSASTLERTAKAARNLSTVHDEAEVSKGRIEEAVELPGVSIEGPEGEIWSEIDWTKVDVRRLIPYEAEVDEDDWVASYRRACMDSILTGVMRYGQASLQAVLAVLIMRDGDVRGFAVPVVEWWLEDNTDGFRDRLEMAHRVFKGRFVMAIVDRADRPHVPKGYYRDNLAMYGVLNAFVSEHFKRGKEVNVQKDPDALEFSKTLILVGEKMELGMSAAKAAGMLQEAPET